MSKFIPNGGFRFDRNRGFVSLDGLGRPIWSSIKRQAGGKIVFTHAKTGKQQSYIKSKEDQEADNAMVEKYTVSGILDLA